MTMTETMTAADLFQHLLAIGSRAFDGEEDDRWKVVVAPIGVWIKFPQGTVRYKSITKIHRIAYRLEALNGATRVVLKGRKLLLIDDREDAA